MKLFYVNDNGDNATIIIDNGKIKVITDLSASEKEYPSLKAAKHDLFTRGYYEKENT